MLDLEKLLNKIVENNNKSGILKALEIHNIEYVDNTSEKINCGLMNKRTGLDLQIASNKKDVAYYRIYYKNNYKKYVVQVWKYTNITASDISTFRPSDNFKGVLL